MTEGRRGGACAERRAKSGREDVEGEKKVRRRGAEEGEKSGEREGERERVREGERERRERDERAEERCG